MPAMAVKENCGRPVVASIALENQFEVTLRIERISAGTILLEIRHAIAVGIVPSREWSLARPVGWPKI